MKGIDRVSAIDASALRMIERLPGMPVVMMNRMRLLRAANQALTTYLDLLLRPLGFTESTLHSLFLLFASDSGTATPGSLCELVGQTKANMTRILDTLAEKNFVSRHADRNDGRRQLIRITGEGKRLVRSVLPMLADPVALSMADLSEKDLGVLEKLLRRLVISLDSGERQLRASI